MFCIKTRHLENKEEIKSITFKDELKIIDKKLGGAQNDCNNYNPCKAGVGGVVFCWFILFIEKKKNLFGD